ncbi:hypothetical protein VBM87_02905 [Mycoplasma sp. 744]|nr:hypothetical protein [Mycoplasma sp. 744]MEA4115716.1 hypothetical protein [Mycoplasma sp. 744]
MKSTKFKKILLPLSTLTSTIGIFSIVACENNNNNENNNDLNNQRQIS